MDKLNAAADAAAAAEAPDTADTAPSSAFFKARLAEVAHSSPVPSPCVNICKMDPQTNVCCGCRRTLDEIAGWSRMDDADKRAVWTRLPARAPAA